MLYIVLCVFSSTMTDDTRKYYVVQFEDGIQIIPKNQFVDGTRTKAYWPNYSNLKYYDKAVKSMQDVNINNWVQVTICEIIGASGKYKNTQ